MQCMLAMMLMSIYKKIYSDIVLQVFKYKIVPTDYDDVLFSDTVFVSCEFYRLYSCDLSQHDVIISVCWCNWHTLESLHAVVANFQSNLISPLPLYRKSHNAPQQQIFYSQPFSFHTVKQV